MRLDELPQRRPAYVDRIDWESMSPSEGQRLREFGVCEGASVELLHRGGWGKGGAVACRVGRMTIAMRANHAAAIQVSTEAAASAVTARPEAALFT
ncbi:MAG TPA: FeoA family protein [Sphingobium sp.]|uniref:FeoA family protein n=1 Tax=Sphingobium sp. TaxID=1912891 RepID=UPI002ED4707D